MTNKEVDKQDSTYVYMESSKKETKTENKINTIKV